jgi:hypothetical protein
MWAARPRAGWRWNLEGLTFARFWNRGWAGRKGLVGRVVLGFGLAAWEAVDGKYADLGGQADASTMSRSSRQSMKACNAGC